ncbi:rhodanese-like domain-containing protein [Mycobacterium sp. NAZ190054]|uniref:rhodanese-like domain-containing protein n=1 Tax=Mycobacterium sp. NAZ190054 TaxID=1747766 RepID=UPI00079468B3|nr:rhodanese-like domain-containing protein [Mycobacterium sp. NAZ190054]KWX69024.1 sulfurtransferase [Mycobacterium sp. NAZ190054]
MTTLAAAADARAYFAAKLAYEIDPADLVVARSSSSPPVVVDTRSQAAWDHGHLPDARHIPGAELRDRAGTELPDRDADIVVYCWGPGCNGATKAAYTLSDMGYRRVRELIGGFEYWAREGLVVVTPQGRTRRPADDLTAVTV